MKKFIVTLAIAMLIGGVAYADYVDTSADVTLTLAITGDFGMTLSDTTLDIGSLMVGAEIPQDAYVNVTAASAFDSPWHLTVQSTVFSDGGTKTFNAETDAGAAGLGLGCQIPERGGAAMGTSDYEVRTWGDIFRLPTSAAQVYYVPNAEYQKDAHPVTLYFTGTAPAVDVASYTATLTVTMKASAPA